MQSKSNVIDIKKLFEIKKVVLAPMAGITSFSYRKLMQKFGVALSYTEMISDCGLIYGNKETAELLKTDGKEGPLAVQLFGGSKETLVKGIEILESMNLSYDILDLNLACPVYKVTRNNGGSSWLKDLNLLEEMIKEVVAKSSKPVSCKIRLGWDDSHINVDEVCKILQDNGVSLIAIHARTTKQGYTGKARYEELKNIREILHIPFIISGDIFTADDAINAMNITGADAVMIARGGTGNPLLVKEINSRTAAILNEKEERNFFKQKEFLEEYAKNLIEEKGEDRAIRLLRGIAPKFFSYFPFSKEIRKRICMNIKTWNDLKEILDEFTKMQLNPEE